MSSPRALLQRPAATNACNYGGRVFQWGRVVRRERRRGYFEPVTNIVKTCYFTIIIQNYWSNPVTSAVLPYETLTRDYQHFCVIYPRAVAGGFGPAARHRRYPSSLSIPFKPCLCTKRDVFVKGPGAYIKRAASPRVTRRSIRSLCPRFHINELVAADVTAPPTPATTRPDLRPRRTCAPTAPT
ncbi:hypothetical protein EVAR_22967_1 [Eumeta japonica]|uniref:Uncharacterized protein n=1 Tax=Eumeta variegata TaxID=151549 RepID=A0A4C1URP5_EUMVA|nr:hypothetical protein EVAR_22967_1 [Eumeta japonica]